MGGVRVRLIRYFSEISLRRRILSGGSELEKLDRVHAVSLECQADVPVNER